MSDQRSYRAQFIYESPPLSPPFPSNLSVVYLIPRSWWVQWCDYSGYCSSGKGPEPSHINNSNINLSKPSPEDYIYLTKVTWRRLKNWHSYDSKKIAFVRNQQPDFSYINTVVTLNNYNTRTILVPLWYTLFQFKARVQKKLRISGFKCKFRLVFPNGNDQVLSENGKTLNELEFYDDIKIIVKSKATPDKTVTFAGYGNEDEEEDLKKAMAASLNQVETREIDQNQVQLVKQALAEIATAQKYRLETRSLPELIQNLQKIFESLEESC